MAEILALKIIDGLPASLRRITDGLSAEELRYRPAAAEWSMVEILGHLIDKTEAWGERFHRMATEQQPVMEGYDQDEYVRARGYQEQSAPELLARLTSLLSVVSAELRTMDDAAWARNGRHSERGILTLGDACRIYAVSLPDHVTQLVEARDAAMSRGGRPPGGPTGS